MKMFVGPDCAPQPTPRFIEPKLSASCTWACAQRTEKRRRYCCIDDRQFGDVSKSHFAAKTRGLD